MSAEATLRKPDLSETRIRRRYDAEAAEKAEAALRHFAGVLLHGPSVRARELAGSGRRDEFLDGLHAVFGIERPA